MQRRAIFESESAAEFLPPPQYERSFYRAFVFLVECREAPRDAALGHQIVRIFGLKTELERATQAGKISFWDESSNFHITVRSECAYADNS